MKRICRREVAKYSAGRSGLSRAVQVLEAFDPRRSELTLTQVAARTGMSLSTVHGIVGELLDLGLLERRGRELILGVKLWELAVRAPGVFGLRECARPYLEEVRDKLNQHAQLGILEGTDVLYLERLSAAESTVNFTLVGGRFPWYATSSGLVLVAGLESEELSRVLSAPRPKFSREPTESNSVLLTRLARARQEGHAVTSGYLHQGSTSVAVPIVGPYGRAVASLSVIVPSEGFHLASVLKVVAPAARAISAKMKNPAG
ncbi:IclR family transcriptional regulator [Paenarthrobacter sp. NPDC090520]|uniref:IclR family transcriptional regulator n=1 Tax=Paenarthrobacter sp. NPDC090520 TaxID=3364382 RepID=UPI0038181F8E